MALGAADYSILQELALERLTKLQDLGTREASCIVPDRHWISHLRSKTHALEKPLCQHSRTRKKHHFLLQCLASALH